MSVGAFGWSGALGSIGPAAGSGDDHSAELMGGKNIMKKIDGQIHVNANNDGILLEDQVDLFLFTSSAAILSFLNLPLLILIIYQAMLNLMA